jgi:hypothetical protein
VLITQSIEELPFDLRTYRASEYSTRFDEAQKLKEFLREVGGQAANGSVKFASPVSDFLPDGPAAERLLESMNQERSTHTARAPSATAKVEDEVEDEDEGEPGALDLLHSYVESAEKATTILERISNETTAMGSQIQAHTERMQEAIASSSPGSVAKIHRVATDVAQDLGAYGDVLRQELPDLEQASEKMIESGIQWLTRTGKEQDTEDVEGFRLQLAGMYLVVAEALVSTREYRGSFQEGRGVTSQLDKASDRVVGLLGRLIAVMENTQSFASRGCDIAQELLDAGELHVVAEPEVACFADPEGKSPQSFSGVLLATFDRGVAERVLPFTGEPLQKHSAVSWALNEEKRFPETWYCHPYLDTIERAWSESPEFVGEETDGKAPYTGPIMDA